MKVILEGRGAVPLFYEIDGVKYCQFLFEQKREIELPDSVKFFDPTKSRKK